MAHVNYEVDKSTLSTQIITEISGYEFAIYEAFFPLFGHCINTKILHSRAAAWLAPSSFLHHSFWERVGLTSSTHQYCCIQKCSRVWLNKVMNIYNFLTDFFMAATLPVWPLLDCSLRAGMCHVQTLRFLTDTSFQAQFYMHPLFQSENKSQN